MAERNKISPLLLDEYLASGDERFLATLRQFHEPKKLAAIADKWKVDHRPWARKQIFEYLQLPFDAAGHETVVKRLFKHAEQKQDDELMAAFAVAFDRLVRRRRAGQAPLRLADAAGVERRVPLLAAEQAAAAPGKRVSRIRGRGKVAVLVPHAALPPPPRVAVLPADGVQAAERLRRSPSRTCSRDTSTPTSPAARTCIDNWSLVHACFAESEVLEFTASHVAVERRPRRLSELTAAPAFEDLWKTPASAKTLANLLLVARSRPGGRVWAIAARSGGTTRRISRRCRWRNYCRCSTTRTPRSSNSPRRCSRRCRRAGDRLSCRVWLQLLQTRSVTALETIAQLMHQARRRRSG